MVASRKIFQNDNTTVYVDQAGDNANDGLTPSTPKQTIQAMMDTLFREYDHGGTALRIQLADCPVVNGQIVPYAGAVTRGAMVGHYGRPDVGGNNSSFTLYGNPTDRSKVVIDGGSAPAVQTVVGKSLHLDWLTLKSNASMGVASTFAGTEMVLHNIAIDACGDTAILAQSLAMVTIINDIDIIGDAPQVFYADRNSEIEFGSVNVRIVGQRNFSGFFIGAARNSTVNVQSATFSLASGASAAGIRWATLRGGQIDTGGRNPDTLFPGSINGVVRIGGGYCG